MKFTAIARVLTAAAITTATAGATTSSASAAPERRVTICHATASATTPYVRISVDMSSVVGSSGHGASGINEGDIIPPIPGLEDGHNWDPQHQAILMNGCKVPAPDSPPADWF